eukprot:169600_1
MEDLRNSIQGWSLESDDRLLRALSAFSNKIVERTKQVNDDLETLGEQTRATQSQLQNTFNRFLMLQSGQFIENRVVRDQQTAKKIHEEKQQQQQNSQSQINGNETQSNTMQSATQIIETYKRALNLGMVAMEHTVPQSVLANALQSQQDSIEAGMPPSLPKCHKDPYNNQPLPYIIGTPEFSKNEDLGLFGAFNDNVFYNIIEEESEDEQESGSSEAEDFDFTWMKQYVHVLLPQLDDYYDPEDTTLYRDDVRSFFADAEQEQIDDIFEYYEDDNGYDTAQQSGSEWINVTQLIQLLQECDRDLVDGTDEHVPKKKKGPRVAVGLAAALNDQLAQIGSSSEDEDVHRAVKEHKKKKRKNSDKKPSAAIFAAIDDFDTSSEEDDGGIGTGFFTSDKKTDIKDFGLSDDSDDDFGISAALTGDENKKKKKKEVDEVDQSEKKSDPFGDSDGEEVLRTKTKKKKKKKKNPDPFGDSDESDDEFMDAKPTKTATKKAKAVAKDMFDDSDDDSDGGFKIDPTKLLPAKTPQKKVQSKVDKLDMFDDSDEDEFEDLTAQRNKTTKVKAAVTSDMFGDSEDDDPLFGSTKSISKPKKAAKKVAKEFDFDDSDEDPLFSLAQSKPNPKAKPKPKKDSIFDNSDNEEEGEMSSVGIKINVHKMHMTQGLTVAQIKARKHGHSKPSPKPEKPKSSDPLGGMFGDSDDDGNTGLDIKPKKKATPVKQDLFGDSDDEDEVQKDKGEMSSSGILIDVHKLNMGRQGMTVAQIKARKQGKPVQKAEKKSTKRKDPLGGMFGDSDEDDEDFDVKPTATPTKKAKHVKKKKDVDPFADSDEDLFGDIEKQEDEAKKKKTPTAKPKSDLFDDADDKGEMSAAGIKIDVHKLSVGRQGMTVAKIKSLKADKTKREDPLASMFGEDAEEDKDTVLDTKPIPKKKPKAVKKNVDVSRGKSDGAIRDMKTKVPSFFDEDEDGLGDLFASKSKKKKKNKSAAKSLFDDDDDDDDFFLSKKSKKKGKKGKKGKKKTKSLFDLNSDDEDAFDKQQQQQKQPTKTALFDEPQEIKPATIKKEEEEEQPPPKRHSLEETKETPIVKDEAQKPVVIPSKKKHKMNAKLAAKFGHLNFDPTKMKVGASPRKRKQETQEMDQSVLLNKATVSKRGRRKRTKKKLKMDDDMEEKSAVSASLFAAQTEQKVDEDPFTTHKQETKAAFDPLQDDDTAPVVDDNEEVSKPKRDDPLENLFGESDEEDHDTLDVKTTVTPKKKAMVVKEDVDPFADSEEENVLSARTEKETTPIKQDPLSGMFDEEVTLFGDSDGNVKNKAMIKEDVDPFEDFEEDTVHDAPPKKAASVTDDPLLSGMFGDSEAEDIVKPSETPKEKAIVKKDTTPVPEDPLSGMFDEVVKEEKKRKEKEKKAEMKSTTKEETSWKLDLDEEEKPKRKVSASTAEDELDALFGDEPTVAPPKPTIVKDPTPPPPVEPEPEPEHDLQQQPKEKEVEKEKETTNIFDDSDSDDMWSSKKKFKKLNTRDDDDFDSLFD